MCDAWEDLFCRIISVQDSGDSDVLVDVVPHDIVEWSVGVQFPEGSHMEGKQVKKLCSPVIQSDIINISRIRKSIFVGIYTVEE